MRLGGVSTHHHQIVSATVDYGMDIVQKRIGHKTKMDPVINNPNGT